MIGIIIALVIALGVGGTVVADTARPGDLLFPVDQVVETVRFSLAGDDKKNELRIKFSEERISEIEDLVGESSDESDDADKDSLSIEEQEHVTVGIEAVLNLLAQLKEQEQSDARIDSIIAKLNEYTTTLPSNGRIKISDDKLYIKFEDDDDSEEVEVKDNSKNGTLKAEFRTDEERIKIKVKDGVLEIKTKADNDSDDDKEDDEAEDDDDAKDSDDGLEEIEAKILSDKTVVQIELNDEETTFTTSATSREAIIAAIIAKFPSLTSAEITAVLKIETEDDDSDDDKEDDEAEDDDDAKDSDDQSDSNSGSDDNQ